MTAATAATAGGFLASSSIQPVECAASGTRSDWPPPILTNQKIYSKLSSPMETITPVQRGVVKEYHVNQYGANMNIEDTIAIMPSLACPPGGFLAGVFDGHSGKDASKWCSEELLPYLQVSLTTL